MTDLYKDIISLPHPVSVRHARMPIPDRAAQFAPFAALTGYDAAIREAARLTDQETTPDEDAKILLDQKQQLLIAAADEHPEITVTYFVPDAKKSGGTYRSASGCFRKVDPNRRLLILTDGTAIPLDNILELESDWFPPPFI